MTSPPMTFSETPASIRLLAPRLGEHSVEVLREAGFDEDTIQEMMAAGEEEDNSDGGGEDGINKEETK